jgi:hypothetical protein
MSDERRSRMIQAVALNGLNLGMPRKRAEVVDGKQIK